MIEPHDAMKKFLVYASKLKGDEKGEAQVFCDRFFQAFGHEGFKEAGAEAESRQKRGKGKGTGFIDLLWRPRLLLEMKRRGEKLQKHYSQAFDYWLRAVPQRPKYVVLCNFDEFWIYDFDIQLEHPVDVIKLDDLPARYTAFNFMFPLERKPQFQNNRVDVTKVAAQKVANVYNSLIKRKVAPATAQRFVLQCVVAMYSEDAELLKPPGIFLELLGECIDGTESSYDLIGGLFRQMNTKAPAAGGRYKEVRYFNGGIFEVVEPLELNETELKLLKSAAEEKWDRIQPAIFGTIYQDCLGKNDRHAQGAHYTSEADIQKVVLPTIVRPWEARIDSAKTLKELTALLNELRTVTVLDPACGSGNFLYVAYREIVRLEFKLMARIHEEFGAKAKALIGTRSGISIKRFFGIEKNPLSVELAKVTLVLAKETTISDMQQWIGTYQTELPFEVDSPLPLDNLNANILCDDALFCEWPEADVYIGNPPFQSKNKAQEEYGAAYMAEVRAEHPEVPGRADYCVYWLRRVHEALKSGQRAGLVGTNTIRQNYSRVGGLDHIVKNGGTITEAVSTQVWSGDAVVNVSIVNWIKGEAKGIKRLYFQDGDNLDSPWRVVELPRINSALSAGFDVTTATPLEANKTSGLCLQGQTHGHEAFLVAPAQAARWIQDEAKNDEVLFPYMIGNDLLSDTPRPSRYVIDFHPRDVIESSAYRKPFKHLESTSLLADRQVAYEEERERNKELRTANPTAKGNKHHENFLKKWWLLSYPREELIAAIRALPRYIACVRVTKRPIFVFLHTSINPGDALQVFTAADDYSFGIVQSGLHWHWFTARCSTMKRDPRYTSDTVFDTFPWPQAPSKGAVKAVAAAAVELRRVRTKAISQTGHSLRELYRLLERPGSNPLKDAQADLDSAVRLAFGMGKRDEALQFLLELNQALAAKEESGEAITGPGLPPTFKDSKLLITSDCIHP
jgi:hypothetical protein